MTLGQDEDDPKGSGGRDLAREMQSRLLQEELERRGWNQSDLARATKLPRYTISRLIRGKVLASEDVANRIALALDLDPKALSNLSRRSMSPDLVEGVHSTPQADGMVRLRMNALVHPGVHLAVEALADYDQPLRTERLANVLRALYEPLPRKGG